MRVGQISASLAAATCTLLGIAASEQVSAQALEKWQFDTAVLVYSESDDRVSDFSFNGLARKELREDSFLNLKFAIDTLTGASPNGAVPSDSVQTFTRASGNGQFQIAPNEQPLDDTFRDTRVAISANWQQPLTRLALLDLGASLSNEFDYTHLGVNARIAHDFNNRNTTLSAGFALASDSINPVGGSPTPFSAMLPAFDENSSDELNSNKRGNESKDVIDLLLGITQVINRQTIVQFNYSLSQADGYLNDPYKILSVVDPITGKLVSGPPASGTSINLYRYENRPDSRQKQSIFGLIKHDFGRDVMDVSYRYLTDDWGINSHTIDLRYRWELESEQFLQPHVRFYSQNEADFYENVLFDGQSLPSYATADNRLGNFDAITIGLKYGRKTDFGEWAARFEVYHQSGVPNLDARVGVLENQDLYPDLTAIIAQFSVKFGSR